MSLAKLTVSGPSDSTLELLAASLKAAGDPLRLEILRVLARSSYGVLELCRIFDSKQPALSHHLKVLANAGLVATRREGNSIYYRRDYAPAEHPLFEIQTALYRALDAVPLAPELEQHLTIIQGERAEASRAFFAANANKFREQQDLIASYPVYADHVAELLANIAQAKTETALEIGPGEGEFLEVLASRFDRVYAVDNSAEMLERARAFAGAHRLDNVALIHGDTAAAIDKQLRADCIIVNMVMHHTPSPGDIFLHCGELLNDGGILLVTDLCRHQQHWVTESCGDLWLGFEPEDFSHWAEAAGLEEGQSNFFALRNGFQIQLRHFYKPD